MLYPQNGDRIVVIDSVTSLHRMYIHRRYTCVFTSYSGSVDSLGEVLAECRGLGDWTLAEAFHGMCDVCSNRPPLHTIRPTATNVCLCVGHTNTLCKNGRTDRDRDAFWG